MSKGKRKSNPEALKLVRQRLNGQHAQFTEEDRGLLLQLCRLDLIQILEEDLCMGPLKASQKNSVACMVDFLLSQQQGPPLTRADSRQRSGHRSSGSDTPVQPGPSNKFPPQALGPTTADVRCPSSGGGSCHTPSTAPEDQQPPLHTPPSTNTAAQQHAAAFADCQPWLAELHHELAAAGNLWGLRGGETTDTDDETTGTEADSCWMPSAADLAADMGMQCNSWQLEASAGVAGTAAALQQQAVLDTSHVEELLVQQLLLDIESAPRAHRSSSFRHTPQQQLQPGEERLPPPLLQQKLQQLDQQAQMLKQQQEQQIQLQQALRQQQVEQEMQWLEQQTAAEFDRRLQDELIQQLEAAGAAQQQQQQHSQADPLQLTPLPPSQLAAAAAAMGHAPAPAAAAGWMEQQTTSATAPGLSIGVQPSQLASWPLPSAATQASLPAAAAGTTNAGLLLHGLSDASLPLAQGPHRVSLDGGGLVRKRDKMLRELFAVKDEGLTGQPELAVELSGPSAELPTKRMSLTLPGVAEGASLPTSFCGRVAGMGARPQPADLQQLMQFSSCEEATDVWQQQSALLTPARQQDGLAGLRYSQRDQGFMQPGVQGGGAASGGFAGRLKTLLRGKKAKARRHNSVGAGASFTSTSFTGSAGGLPTSRIPSDPVTTRDAAAAAGSAMGWGNQLAPGQQLLGGQHWVDNSSASLLAEGNQRAPAGTRPWHSASVPPVYREHSDPTLGIAAGVAGFSWHAEGGTMLAAGSGSLGAGRPQQGSAQLLPGSYAAPAQPPVGVAGSNSQFVQQLAHLRATYRAAEQHGGDLTGAPYMMQAAEAAGNSSMHPGEKPGLVKKLVRAFKLNSQPAQSPALQANLNTNQGLGERDEELLVMGRSDGQMDLGAALQWQAGPGGPGLLEELLQGFGADMQDDS